MEQKPMTIIDSPLTPMSEKKDIEKWIKTLKNMKNSPEKTNAITIAYSMLNKL